ncbi:MAG: hydrogenase nickel incorporation protein HypB [Pseudomonadota bacterium]
MCTVCGCGEGEVEVEGQDHHHHHGHDGPEQHSHGHGHGASNDEHHHYGEGPAHAHAPGLSQSRMVEIEQNILAKNDAYAATNRRRLQDQGVLALNLVSSPGSGKTSLLTATIEALGDDTPVAVVEGDQQTANDAERIRATGARALQINTGKGCHLDAHMVGHALDSLAPADNSVLFIENVGNLVCPAAFDLGEAHKVVILSVTEGEDKPIKYPDMFHAADLMILNKIDLLPHLQFDLDRCVEYARRVNPDIEVLLLSATTGEGMRGWTDWITSHRRGLLAKRLAAAEAQAAALRAQLG